MPLDDVKNDLSGVASRSSVPFPVYLLAFVDVPFHIINGRYAFFPFSGLAFCISRGREVESWRWKWKMTGSFWSNSCFTKTMIQWEDGIGKIGIKYDTLFFLTL